MGGSKHDVMHGWLAVSSYRPNPFDPSEPSLFDGWWRKLCPGPGRQLDHRSDIPGVTGHMQKTLAPDMPSASIRPQRPHQMRLWSDHLAGPFWNSLSFVQQDSWPISTKANPCSSCTFMLLKRRKVRLQIFMLTNRSVGKILLRSLR